MPCYRCGTRQVDPDRGESPWKRGVRGDRQVLVCPGCQAAFDWTADLDRCAVCGGIHLVRRLGETECKDCGCVRDPAADAGVAAAGAAGPDAAGPAGPAGSAGGPGAGGAGLARPDDSGGLTPGLAEEVEQALARVLGRAQRPAGIS
jgi:hypothetical protein